MTRIIISIHFFLCFAIVIQGQESSLNVSIAQEDLFKSAQVGISVKQVGELVSVFSLNEEQRMTPASTQKITTCLAALEKLGSDFTFDTHIVMTGDVRKGVLFGDVVIVGGGDPTFCSQDFLLYYNTVYFNLNKALKNLGITSIEGKVIGYSEKKGLPSFGIAYEDVGNYYGATSSSLNFMDNEYSLYLSSDARPYFPTTIVRTVPNMSEITFDNGVTSSNLYSDEAYIIASPYSNKAILTGTIPKDKKSFVVKGAMPDPAYTAAKIMTQELRQGGITISGDPISMYGINKPIASDTLLVVSGAPLKEIINQTLRKSQNLYAQTIFEATSTGGLKDFWREKLRGAMDEYDLLDGSGLSTRNRISPRMMTNILALANDAEIELLCKGLARLEGKDIYVKTGYMHGVRGLSGYMKKYDTWFAYTFIINNHSEPSGAISKSMRKYLIDIYNEL